MKTISEAVEEWKQGTLKELCGKCHLCCSSNISELTEEQAMLMFGTLESPKNKQMHPMLTKNGDGTYATHYIDSDACPALADGRCRIYDNPLRPQCCRDFPIFIDEEEKALSFHNVFCPATDLSNLAPLVIEAINLRYIVMNMFGEIRALTPDDLKPYLK